MLPPYFFVQKNERHIAFIPIMDRAFIGVITMNNYIMSARSYIVPLRSSSTVLFT